MKITGKTFATLGLVLAFATGCGGEADTAEEPSTAPSTPETLTVVGDLTLYDYDIETYGGECYGVDGYDDLEGGAQVVVRDAEGKSVGLGSLDPGVKVRRGECRFDFEVTDVPPGLGIYSVEVSHRGEIQFKESEAEQISLSLGD